MENLALKESFLRDEYVSHLEQIKPDSNPKWGKMNVQQMIEHMSDYVRIANGKTVLDVVTPVENLPKMQAFLMSEKPFRENTPNALMPDIPPAIKFSDIKTSIEEIRGELTYFFQVYAANPNLKLTNPFFGLLDFDMQVQLLHKHATHHLRQFGVDV